MKSRRRGTVLTGLVLALGLLNWAQCALGQADNAANPAAPPPAPALQPADDFSGSPLGSMAGLRPWLGRDGIKVSGNYTAEVLGNLDGGRKTGAIAEGLLELDLDADLNAAFGLPGASLHVGGFDIHGPSLTRNYTGDLSTVSSIDAFDTVRFAEWWYQQNLWNERLSLKIGQFLTENEFYYSDYGNLFICGSFGAFIFLGDNFPSAPNYPMSAPGIRLLAKNAADTLELRVAVYSGSTGVESENHRGLPHLAGGDGVLSFGEAVWRHGKDAGQLPCTLKLGMIFHSRYEGYLNANLDSSDRGEYGFYFVADQAVWRKAASAKETNPPSFGVFTRLAYMPANFAFITRYGEAGFNFNGILPNRQDDTFGVALTHSAISGVASRLSVRRGGPSYSGETLIEATYNISLKSYLKLQPDFQYIVDPGAQRRGRDATVAGLRTNMTF